MNCIRTPGKKSLALAGAVDPVVREYLEAYPQHTEAMIQLFRAAQRRGFEEWKQLRLIVEEKARRGS
jgi:hypothetical protein